jgi:RNA 3'-terminal phosphate cyclase (ATP)
MMMLSLFPLALFAGASSVHRVKGGLFQDFAPPAFHMKYVLLPVLRLMGIAAELEILRPGYVPRGGGLLRLSVDPPLPSMKPLTLEEQGDLSGIEGISLSSRLRVKEVAGRMARECRETLARAGYASDISEIYDEPGKPAFGETAIQAGAALAVWARTASGGRIGADMAGAPGRPAEKIGKETALRLLADIGSGATADRHLSDQLIPFAALAEGISVYRIPFVTDHVEARLWLIEIMLGAKTELTGNRLVIHGIGYKKESGRPPRHKGTKVI